MTNSLPSAVYHGARDYKELAQLGLHPDDVIDFSTNSNPYGPHPAVLQAVQQAVTKPNLAHYPDRYNLALSQALATAEGVSPEHILPTNGASELIQLIGLMIPQRDRALNLILAPTFGEYHRAIKLAGGQVVEYRPTKGLTFSLEEVIVAIEQTQPTAIWLCNPNNPTGQCWSPGQLQQLMATSPHTLWVIDESYRYFQSTKGKQQRPKNFTYPPDNAIIIRSLTKAHALAGLRLGYAIAHPTLIEALQAIQPPWSVNRLAQIAGIAAVQPTVLTWRNKSLACLHKHATELWAALIELGYPVLPTDTTYTLVNVGDVSTFRHQLLQKGLLVRNAASFGLPEYVRIAARLPEENEQLLRVIKSIKD